MSDIISGTISHRGSSQLSAFPAFVDGGRCSLSAVVLFRRVAVRSIDQILCRLQMLEECYWI